MKNKLKPKMSFDQLLYKLKLLKTKRYFYTIRKFSHCFTGNIAKDVRNANRIILTVESDNTAHITSAAFQYAFNAFYGQEFNCKYLEHRSHAVSKLTTRLNKSEIDLVKTKLLEWIQNANSIKNNTAKYVKMTRIRFFYIFEALLYTGMRGGELAAINFKTVKVSRFVVSDISKEKFAEIIINTEKTCKQREIYLPVNVYNFFAKDNKKFDVNYISHNFVSFRNWAKLPFFLSGHVLRRTKATILHEYGVDESTISMILGNTPDVIRSHYIISSIRNFDACDIGNCYVSHNVVKNNNVYWNYEQMKLEKKQ